MTESVLAIPVPEAEPLVGPFRREYDSSAAEGMPAHITINYPFLPGEIINDAVIRTLTRLFSEHRSFEFSLTTINRFPGVIYLEPTPDRPFRDLIEAVVGKFPQSPPYEGKFDDTPPHLTVALSDSREELEVIDSRFADACARSLPIKSRTREVWLFDNANRLWVRRNTFSLGS